VVKILSKTNPFDFVKSVSSTKKDIMLDDVDEKSYAPYLTNKSLSYHKDAIFFANEMNLKHGVDHRLQYLFFLNTLRSRNRFSKWDKPYKSIKLETIREYYGISNREAQDYLQLLTEGEYREIKKRMEKGGNNGRN
tara:strand:- start:54 stop:461 length:408 start_codon:yes stop_codon:yes gene_type:complete